MKNHFILTPYFLDEERPGLDALAGPDWIRNTPELPTGEQIRRLSTIYNPLADSVARAIKSGARPISIVNDCCASLGMIAGLQRAGVNPTLIWFDAHGDFNTWETTPSGFLGGMPLAWLVGRGDMTVVDGLGMQALPEKK